MQQSSSARQWDSDSHSSGQSMARRSQSPGPMASRALEEDAQTALRQLRLLPQLLEDLHLRALSSNQLREVRQLVGTISQFMTQLQVGVQQEVLRRFDTKGKRT